jgi:hypothetical protein
MAGRYHHAEKLQLDLSPVMVPGKDGVDPPVHHRGKELRLMTAHERGRVGISHRQANTPAGDNGDCPETQGQKLPARSTQRAWKKLVRNTGVLRCQQGHLCRDSGWLTPMGRL